MRPPLPLLSRSAITPHWYIVWNESAEPIVSATGAPGAKRTVVLLATWVLLFPLVLLLLAVLVPVVLIAKPVMLNALAAGASRSAAAHAIQPRERIRETTIDVSAFWQTNGGATASLYVFPGTSVRFSSQFRQGIRPPAPGISAEFHHQRNEVKKRATSGSEPGARAIPVTR